jgi:hypothetical protein
MRKLVIAFVVIALVWIGYTAWPLYELAVLVRAIEAASSPQWYGM